MAVNVTQKDKTLTEIIHHCEESVDVWASMPGDFSSGYRKAMRDTAAYCRERLGYSGSMPLEVPNQSEQAHVMATALSNLDWGRSPQFDHYECSCGYSTRDPYEAESHINVRKQLGQSVYWKEATES